MSYTVTVPQHHATGSLLIIILANISEILVSAHTGLEKHTRRVSFTVKRIDYCSSVCSVCSAFWGVITMTNRRNTLFHS